MCFCKLNVWLKIFHVCFWLTSTVLLFRLIFMLIKPRQQLRTMQHSLTPHPPFIFLFIATERHACIGLQWTGHMEGSCYPSAIDAQVAVGLQHLCVSWSQEGLWYTSMAGGLCYHFIKTFVTKFLGFMVRAVKREYHGSLPCVWMAFIVI